MCIPQFILPYLFHKSCRDFLSTILTHSLLISLPGQHRQACSSPTNPRKMRMMITRYLCHTAPRIPNHQMTTRPSSHPMTAHTSTYSTVPTTVSIVITPIVLTRSHVLFILVECLFSLSKIIVQKSYKEQKRIICNLLLISDCCYF